MIFSVFQKYWFFGYSWSTLLCLFTFEVPFKRLFAPTSWSRMSKIFRDLASLGKSNGKKWSQIWIFLFESGIKLPRKKKIVFCWFCRTKHVENHASQYVFEFLCFRWFFSVFQKIWVFGYSWSTLLCYWCYYPHQSRDALSPVCGIFIYLFRYHLYIFRRTCVN